MSTHRDPIPAPVTWEDALARYLQHLAARRASPRTIDQRRRDLEHLRGALAALPLGDVSLSDLRRYQLSLVTGEGAASGRALAAGTLARVASSVRALFRFLVAEELLASDPSARLERPRLAPATPGPLLSVAEVKRLLAAPDPASVLGLRDRALLEVLYATGVRRAELAGLDRADLCARERELTVLGKGEKRRVLPVTRSAWRALERYAERARPALAGEHPDGLSALFLSRGGRRLTSTDVYRVVRALGRRAGLRREVAPHMLRRSFATELLRAGASLRHLQLLLGHEHLDTTAVYLKVDALELRRELVTRHPRERFEV